MRATLESADDSTSRPATQPLDDQSGASNDVRDLFAQIKAFVLRDTQTTVITGMACGAVLGRIIGFGWVIGAIIGGFATYKYLESK